MSQSLSNEGLQYLDSMSVWIRQLHILVNRALHQVIRPGSDSQEEDAGVSASLAHTGDYLLTVKTIQCCHLQTPMDLEHIMLSEILIWGYKAKFIKMKNKTMVPRR